MLPFLSLSVFLVAGVRDISAISFESTDTVRLQQHSRLRCSSNYNSVCSYKNARWRAQSLLDIEPSASFLSDVNAGLYNLEGDFEPVVIEKSTGLVAASGLHNYLVNRTLEDIYHNEWDMDYLYYGARPEDSVLKRLVRAAQNPVGHWTIIETGFGTNQAKVSTFAFVVSLSEDYLAFVGYSNVDLEPQLPCDAGSSGFCAIHNAQMLTAKALSRLMMADSQGSFDATLRFISESGEFQLEGGAYVFVFDFEGDSGKLVAHGTSNDFNGMSLEEATAEMGNPTNGTVLHQGFINAVATQYEGYHMYNWTNSIDEDPVPKISILTKLVFNEKSYYIGSGFSFKRKHVEPENDCSPYDNRPCSMQSALALTSHAEAFVLASNVTYEETFKEMMSMTDQFRLGDNGDASKGYFYVVAYDFVTQECVLHLRSKDYIGKTSSEAFSAELGIPANVFNGTELHENVKRASLTGGIVSYLWPDRNGNIATKLAVVKRVALEGREVYLGVGYSNVQSEMLKTVEGVKTKAGDPVEKKCSSAHGGTCSDSIARSILGQAVNAFWLASAGLSSKNETVRDIASFIARGKKDYVELDFSVQVFPGDECRRDQACWQDQKDMSNWESILKQENLTSVPASEVHDALLSKAKNGGGSIVISSIKKKFWVAGFHHENHFYYAISGYSLAPLELECGLVCPSDHSYDCRVMECHDAVTVVGASSALVVLLGALIIFILLWFLKRELHNGRVCPRHWKRSWFCRVKEGLFRLEPGSIEYETTRKEFIDSFSDDEYRRRGIEIDEIRRVQRPYLYQRYHMNRKKVQKDMDVASSPDSNAERRNMYHGTRSGREEGIALQGLDKGYVGKETGHLYGKGSYLATTALDAAFYSRCNKNGIYPMLRFRALTGNYRQGTPETVSPGSDGDMQFHSTVDDEEQPTIFVLYEDAATLPEYLIYFRQNNVERQYTMASMPQPNPPAQSHAQAVQTSSSLQGGQVTSSNLVASFTSTGTEATALEDLDLA